MSSTQAPDVFTIDGERFSLIAVWQENAITGVKTFQGYMLYPLDKKIPTKPELQGEVE